jgi:hypothetical protein
MRVGARADKNSGLVARALRLDTAEFQRQAAINFWPSHELRDLTFELDTI